MPLLKLSGINWQKDDQCHHLGHNFWNWIYIRLVEYTGSTCITLFDHIQTVISSHLLIDFWLAHTLGTVHYSVPLFQGKYDRTGKNWLFKWGSKIMEGFPCKNR